MKTTKRIRTVLYGDQRVSGAELEILHTPAMQRLYGLRQLGLTDRIFIDASHSRIHHVIGVLEQVNKLVDAIVHNLRRSNRNLRIGAAGIQEGHPAAKLADFVESRRPVVRFIGLLHDLTHAPFGHTVEDEIQLVATKHDDPSRQAEAFYRLLCQLLVWLAVESDGPLSAGIPKSLRPFTAQAVAANLPDASEVGALGRSLLGQADSARINLCWRLSTAEVAEMLAQLHCAMTALLHLELLHKASPKKSDFPDKSEYPFQAAIRQALQGTAFEGKLTEFEFQHKRDAFMLDIVGNTVCADLLDYAKRDSHFAGLRLDYDPDRIAENFTLVSHDVAAYEVNHPELGSSSDLKERKSEIPANPFHGWCLRTAISLISHKYRTDVPSELMNLLNVRFYLYERAIYHPTKCAAGSMLGTALQLIGWRKSAHGGMPTLPVHLRFVGDDVFLHDISSALDFILGRMSALPGQSRVGANGLHQLSDLDRVHNGLVPALINLHLEQTVAEALQDFTAARVMFDRLAARRYFRPVFRALPSSTDKRLQAGADALADTFRDPEARYEVERRIEAESPDLPLGTITIHCPVRTTARKIANVLLTKSDPSGADEVHKLKDIGSLDAPIFAEHQKAVKAVEEMYRSMWRLTVYVAPEHLHKFREIGEAAGRVIFKTIDRHGQFADRDISWENDPTLSQELEDRSFASNHAPATNQPGLSPFGILVGQLGDHLLRSGRIDGPTAVQYASSDSLPVDIRTRLETAIVAALDSKSIHADLAPRTDELVKIFRTYTKRTTQRDIADFKRQYGPLLGALRQQDFDDILGDLRAAIIETKGLEEGAPTVHKGFNFRTLLEVLDVLLKKRGSATN
jgi:HD superfamily phosphohydrolase